MWTATEQTKIKPGERPQRSETGNQVQQTNGECFHHDYRGSVVLCEREKRLTGYEYDACDQLVGISLPGCEWQADYDALGRRTRKR